MNLGTLACCRIEGAACVEIEEIPITDSRLKTLWPRSVFRALVTFAGTEMRLEIR